MEDEENSRRKKIGPALVSTGREIFDFLKLSNKPLIL
jgi:hypothetical protein